MRWNYLFTPKLKYTVGLWMDESFHPTIDNECNYFPILGLNITHISRRGPCCNYHTRLIQFPSSHCDSVHDLHTESCLKRFLLLSWNFVNSLISIRVTYGIFNSSPSQQNDRYFADDAFRCIIVNEKFCFFIKISLKFVPKGTIDNKPASV